VRLACRILLEHKTGKFFVGVIGTDARSIRVVIFVFHQAVIVVIVFFVFIVVIVIIIVSADASFTSQLGAIRIFVVRRGFNDLERLEGTLFCILV